MQPQRGTQVYRWGGPLAVVCGVMTLLALWSSTTAMTGRTRARLADNDRQIAQYYALNAQASYAAEAGVEEARARLRTYAGLYRIIDTAPDDPRWSVTIVPTRELRESGQHQPERVASLQNDLTYTVTIRHAIRPGETAVLRWGDARGEGIVTRNTTRGENIYVITAQSTQGEARRTVAVEAAPEPPPTVPAALYVAGPLHLQSSHTQITGKDSCGEQHQAGVRTPLPPGALTSKHGPTAALTITGAPPVAYQSPPVHVQAMVDTLKTRATAVYTPMAGTPGSPGSAPQWGRPRPGLTLHAPSTCDERHIVHYVPEGAPGRLPSGTAGCGLLLVEGDVEIQGDFAWYGALLVTGSLRLTGGGSKQVTGGVVVAGAVTSEPGGDTSLVYCSEAIAQPTRHLPLRVLSWRDDLSTIP